MKKKLKVKVKNLKIDDKFFSEGLDMQCNKVLVECKLIEYHGMDKYVVEKEGYTVLLDGNENAYI